MSGSAPATHRFHDIYGAHSNAIHRYCYRRLSPSEADDATADVFLVVWRRIDRAPSGEETLLWLYGIARNVVRNYQRSGRRIAKLRSRLAGTAAPRASDASVQVIRRIDDQEILEALARLRPADQEILRLAAWEGLKPAEIGSLLKIDPHAASMRLQRARNRLARLINMPQTQKTAATTPRPVTHGGER
jgi:RNA polymerase sigma-70 factor (ECF subfamily)